MLDKQIKCAIISDQLSFDLQESFRLIHEQGYRYVELHSVFGQSIEECNSAQIAQIKELLDKYDLQVVNIASTIFFLCPLYPNYRVSLFKESFHAIEGQKVYHMAMLHNACRAANALGCKTVRVFPFRYPDNEEIEVVGTKADIAAIAEVLKEAACIAAKYDVVLALENCPYSHCPKGAMTHQIVKLVNDPHVKLLWDPANSYRATLHKVEKQYHGLSLLDEYHLIKDEIVHVHLKNYVHHEHAEKAFEHVALLDGDIDFESLLPVLFADLDCVSLEPEVSCEDAIKSMQQLKKLLEV